MPQVSATCSKVTKGALDTFRPKNRLVVFITILYPLQNWKCQYLLKFSSRHWPIREQATASFFSVFKHYKLPVTLTPRSTVGSALGKKSQFTMMLWLTCQVWTSGGSLPRKRRAVYCRILSEAPPHGWWFPMVALPARAGRTHSGCSPEVLPKPNHLVILSFRPQSAEVCSFMRTFWTTI